MATRKEIAQNQKILYDDAVANNMFQAAVPSFKEFQKRLEGQGYQKMVYDNYKKHNVRGKGFNNLNEFRGAFGGSFYADENKIGVSNRTASILSSANNAVRQAKRNIQTKMGQAKKFNSGRVSPRLKNPLQNQNVQKNEFNYNSTTGKTGTYTTTDGVEFDNEYDATQYQNKLDKYGEEWNNAVDMGIVPSELDKADPDLSDTDVAMRQMERRQEWLNENQDRRSKELNESMHLQGSPFVASGGAVAPSSFNTAISNESNRLSDVEYGAYNTAKAYNQMLRTTLLQELKEQKQSNENAGWWKDKWNDVSNYFGAMFNTMLDPKLYSQGVMDAAISNNLLQVKKGMEDGTIKKGSNAGNAAQAMLGAIQQQQGEAAKQQQYGTKAYQYGDMSGRSLKFWGDFLLSGWRNVMTTGFTKAGEKVGEKMALGALGKWFTKNTGRVLGDMAGSVALAATNQLGSTYNNVIERYVGMNNENGGVTQDKNGDLKFNEGVSLGKAIKDGFGSATIENFSEMFGEYLPGAPKLLSKLGLSKVSAFFEKIGNNAYYKWLSNATNKSGIQGVMAEISEEEFGTALHAAWGDGDGSWSDFNVFTNPDAREKQIDTCLGMFYSVGFMHAPRTAVGAINAVLYFYIKHQVSKADKFGQMMFNDKWDEIKSKIDVTTNAELTKTVLDATRSDSMTAKQKGAVINYAMFLSKLRGFNQAADAKTKDKVEEGDTAPTLSNDLDDAYTEGHNADDADKHNIQLEQNDKANELAAMLHITPEQLHDMADEDLEAMTGQDDKLDKAIYDYQVSTAKYRGVMDGAQDEVDMAAHQVAMETDNMTDLSRGTVRKATIKATGGLEDYEVYIISGNIATHDDGSIDVGNSDDMIIYYDPTTGRKEHADAMMFADLIEELPAADVKAQAVADAKENAIKKIAGIVDGTIDVGSQFYVTDADGIEHTYEVLADNGDGTAMITIDGNVPTELVKGENVQIPYSFADLQQLKDAEDLKRLEAAKAQREQMEKERAAQQTEQTQETEQPEETQPSLDFNQILNDNGNVVLVDVLDKDGNTKYPDSKLFLIRDTGAKAKVVEKKSDGTFVPHAVSKKNVATISSMSLDEYKQAMTESSMIEDNSGAIEGDRGGIEVNNELPPVPDNVTINGDGTYSVDGAVQGGENTTAPAEQTEQTEQTPAMTLEDGTIVPMLEDGNPDFSKLTADQTAELYDSQFGEDADSVISGWVSDAKKALDKANNMTVKGKNFVEQKAAKEAKEKAIADAQAAYDSAIAIRDAYNSRQLAKVEDDAEGRKNLIEKARRKFSRLKSAVKDDAEAVSQLYKDVVGSLLHRLYDGTGIDVTDTIPLTAEEYVASNLGAHSLNYEGTETSKGVKQETGLSREDFAKTQLLAADGKGTTIDDLVHSLWENRPSNLESLDTQDIRNALIGMLNSGFKASEARNYIENLRIAQAENILEEQKKAADNTAFAEENKAESEQQIETAPESEEKTGEDNSDEINDEEDEQTNENINAPEQTKFPDKLKEGSETIEVPEDATDENPLGAQRDQTDLPFSARDNGTQQTTSERAADVEKNKVDDMKVADNIVGEKTRKAFERLAKMMGANIQWQYTDKLGNGWIQETKDADGNVHRTIFITLDSSITEGAQFIFGHEMTHQIKSLNPAAYNELTQLVLDTYGSDAFDKAIDETMKRYSDAGFSGRARDYYAEEVVADAVGEMIRDLNLAHTLAMKMSHPLLAAIHEILQKIKLAFYGTEYSDVTKNIIRSIEQAYVKTAKGEVTNSETGEDVSFSLRQKPEPKKKGIGYKVFVLKDGKLYPPMVANPNGAATPVGVWLDADAAPIAGESKTGRPQVKQGGKGTQGGSGKLAYRPGWHLGVVPYAIQFNRKDADGNKTLFPKNFVFAEVEYAADVDYQEEARQEGINPSGKYQHSLAGLKHLPTDGYYMYRTNPNPETDPWVITGAMKVNRILTRAEQAELVKNAGREPQQIQEGDIVTDDVVNSINQEIADAPKFSLKVYHGSGADFTEFDFDHMGEGAGSQVFGWGGYVTSSKKIGKSYATLMDNDPSKAYYRIQRSNGTRFAKKYPTLESFLHGDKQIAMNDKFTEQEKIDYYNEMKKLAEPYHNLYEVDIPEDNGSNYLDWDAPITDELIDKVAKALPSLRSYDIKDLKKDRTFDNFYKTISMRSAKDDATFNDDKAASQLLASLGYTGIKYKAGRNFGGAEEGDTNYVIFKPEDMIITDHTKFSLKSKPVRFEAGKKLSDEEKKEVLSTLKDAYKVNGVPYHIEETAGGKEKRVYEPTADSYVVSDITNRPLRYYITLPDGRVAHPTEVYPNISDNEVKSSATKQGLLDEEVDQIVSAAIDNMKDIADNAKTVEILNKLQNLPHETHDVGYGLNHARSYNYKTGIFTSDAAQAIDYVVRRMRRKEDVPAEIPAALKKAVADSYGMVDNLIDGMSNTKVGAAEIKPVGVGAFGNIYNQFRGKAKAAIDFLKKLGSGEAAAALHHHTIGDISLVWGDKKTGLDKILRKHPEVVGNLQSIIDSMEVVQESDNRIKLESPTHFAVVSKEYKGEPREQWLLTAYEKRESLENGKSMDTATSSLGGDTALSQSKEFAAKIDNSSETTKENGEKVDSDGIKFSLKDEKIKSIAEKFGVNEDDVAMYANAVERGSTAEAARARANIKRYLLQANEDKISSFKDIIKYTKPINEALKENFGDLDAMIEERRKQVEAQRNAMEAARKRAQEEEEKRQKHLDELSLIPTDELDKRYMDAIANNDESTAREMLDESARRNGYGDVDSDYQGQGAWAAPSNPQYESDEARRADIENSPDVNLEDIALGYNLQPDDYFDNPRAYMNNTAYGLESAHVIKNALDAIKNGEKDVKVKVYRAVPTSVKEGKLRNGDWVTPSKKYAEMHGDNRLDGKYRIIEDEVPANQLWWDGNDVNEFGFDDGKEYRYKNAKNNRKLNDLITYDNKGNVIPPSKRFNSRKNDIRFSLAGERGAAAADKAEERTARMDNLSVARKMEEEKKDAKAIKMATGWERGADGKWRYEMPDAKIKDTMDVGGGHIVKRYEDDMLWNGGKLSKVIDAPELFKAYPQLKDVRIETDAIMNDMPSNGEYNAKTNTITIHADELKYMNSILNHEIQHVIQSIEGFDRGGSPRLVRGEIKKRLAEVTNQIRQLRAEGKEDEAKAIVEKNRGLYNAYQANDDYNSYKSLAGEVEARNVQERMNMTPEERRKTLAESTEDVARKDQIFLGVGDVSFSLRDMADGKESGVADMAEDLKSLNTPGEVDDAIKTAIEDMPSGWRMANKKMIHIAQALGENRKAEIAGEEPKFSLKDGSLIKAGTYFSGGGLVEEGLKGIIDPVVAVEYDEKISGVYRNNFGQHIVTADVRDVDPKELVKQIDGEVEYFHASPVCKNYSQAKSNHSEVELDKETAASTAEFINAIKPKVVTIENVKGYKDSEAMKIITDALDTNGYTWDADVYNAADYGGYTNRERLIVRAIRDGKLPAKPKKMAHKSGWYEAVADIIPTLTEKKNGVAPWMDVRLKADGIDWRNIDKPLYVMGSAYADGKVPHAFADELLPTLRTKSGDVIVMPDGKVYRAMGRVLARVSGVSDDYKMPFSENLSHTIIGNGIPTQLTEHVIAPLLTGSDPKFSLKKTNNVKYSRIIPTDVDKSVSSQIEKKYDSAIKEVMNKVAERDKRLVSNYIEQDLSDFSKMRREDINQELKSNENWRRKNLREENREGSTYGITDARHRITEATAERELEYRDVRAKYLSETYGLQGGRQTSLDMVDRAFEDTLGNETNRGELRELYGKARKILVQVGAEFGGVANAKQEGDLGFAGTDRDISLFIDTMTRTSTPQSELAHTILHEMIHQATIGSINLVKKGMADGMLTPKQIEAVNTIINTYDAYKADRRLVWEEDNYRDYGGKDEYEFAAEMADAKQRRILSIPYGERILNAANELKRAGDISLWQAIKNALRRLFEVSDKSKMDKALSDIMDDFNKNIDDISMNNIEQTDFGLNGNTRFSLRYDKFEHDLNQWKKDNNLPKDAKRPTIPQRNAGESAVDFLRRVDEYRKMMALWKTAPTYEQHLLSDDTALGEFNRELQRGSVLKRIAFQDSMLAIRKAQEAIMNEVGVDRLNMAEDAYTAENRSHGKGKNEFEEYNNEFLQPLRKAYHQMKKVLGDSYDNVRVYMMAKHGLERDAQMAFKKSLEADYEDVNQRSAAYKAYKNDLDRVTNDADLEFGRVDFTTWRQKDNALRGKYSPSYMDYRYDDNGIAYDYSGLSSLFDGSDFEEAAHRLVRDVETKHLAEVQALWNATNAATKKILRDGFKAGMMSKDAYEYVKGMYSHYIPLRGWDGTTADQVWDYIGGGKGAFNQTLKTAHGRTSIADDPIAYIENMAESGILLNNKNWVKQHLMLLAQNHPTSLLTLSKAWYVKSTDANGNEEWIPATPQITSQMNSNQVKAAIDAFEQKMEQLAQSGDATQQRDGLNIAYPQTHSEEREHEVRVMKDGEEYVIYVNGDPQLAQAMNNTRAHRVSEGIKNSISKRVIAVVGRKMAAAYTSLSPLFIPSNYFRDLTMTLASTAIREDAKYNYLLGKNLTTSWNLGFMLRDFQNGKLRDKVNNGNATPKEQMFYDFMMNGGETGFVSSLDVEDLKKKFKNDLKDLDRWKANPVKVGHTIMDIIEFLNRMIEDSNRFAIYMTSIQYGRSIDEAVNDAKDVTLNFNRKGTGEHSWQTIRNLYLFINPAVQSLQTLGALAKHHPFKFTAVTASWIASGVLVPIVNAALMQMAAAFLGGDGDDDKDWYKDISKKYWQFSKWDRRNNFIMWVPTTHEFVKIPLAQEFRAFYGIGDMIASKMMGGELAEETWSQYAEDLLGQVVDMLPLDPTGYDGNIAVSLMPNPIRPVFELAFNVDFTGKPLFKETEYNKYDPNFTKAYVGTPDWLVRVSKMVNSIGNDYPDVQQNAIDAFGDPRYNLNNPAVVDHVLSSYLGGAYTMGSQVLGVLTKSLNDPKEIKMADIPLVSKFVSNPDDRPVTKKQGDEFWNMKENHDRAANTMSKLKKQAKVDGDYSMLERFYGSEEYKQYKQEDVKVKKYEEDKKKERAEESGEEYRPHKLNAEDIYKAHATPKDDFEDLKLKQLFTKLNGFKTSYDLLVDTAPGQSDGYYNTNKAAIDAIDEISLDKQEISELKKGFLEDGKDAYNAEDMKRIRELRKRILSVLEPANKVVVANQKAKAEKK